MGGAKIRRRKKVGVQFGACNSTSAAIARGRASEIAGAVIKVLGRRANSFPVTNYGVLYRAPKYCE